MEREYEDKTFKQTAFLFMSCWCNRFQSERERIKIVPFDLGNFASIGDAMQGALQCFGHVDILINNGGLSHRGSVAETSVDVDVSVMNVNYHGQVAVTKGTPYATPFLNKKSCYFC